MPFVYILKMVNGSYYIGSCNDFEKRLDRHRKGLVRSTKHKLPFELIYLKECGEYKLAYNEEMRIKSWKKRKSIENLIEYDSGNMVGPIV